MARRGAWLAVGAALLAGLVCAAQEEGPSAVVIDAAGKEAKLTGVKVTTGTRRLGWLADAKGDTLDEKKGPLALEVREAHSTTYAKGVLTLIPVGSVESLKYEYDKQAMAVAVKGVADPVVGTLQFRGINAIGLEGVADGAPAKYSGGVAKGGIKSVTFSGAKPIPPRSGTAYVWSVQIDQPKAGNPWVTARNLKPLFALPGGAEVLLDAVPARKGEPFTLAGPGAVKRVEMVAVDLNNQAVVVEVTDDAGKERLVVIPGTRDHEGKPATLVGLLGEIDAGWKLFPLAVVKAIKFEGKKLPVD